MVILNVEVEPEMIDVNVHPNKLEIKFSDEHAVYSAVYNALTKALNPTPTFTGNVGFNTRSGIFPIAIAEANVDGKVNNSASEYESHSIDMIFDSVEICNDYDIKYLGQYMSTYLLAVKDGELYIIDQHAAHERILYEKYVREFKSGNIKTQRLLIPTILELKDDEKSTVMENLDLFNTLGYEIEDFGEKTIAIRSVPIFFDQPKARLFVEECIAYLSDKSNRTSVEEMLFKKACKAAVKAKDTLTEEEAIELIKSLFSCENPYNCPHGRPTIIKFTKYDLEKMFKRVV